jgi:hypothetical protein
MNVSLVLLISPRSTSSPIANNAARCATALELDI